MAEQQQDNQGGAQGGANPRQEHIEFTVRVRKIELTF